MLGGSAVSSTSTSEAPAQPMFVAGAPETPRRTHTPHAAPKHAGRGARGRTQYVLRSSHGSAQPAMRRDHIGPPPSPPLSPEPLVGTPKARMDPMTHVSRPGLQTPPAASALSPVLVEGLGRVLMPPALLGAHEAEHTPPPPYVPRLGGASGTGHPHERLPQLAWPDAPDSPWNETWAAMSAHTKRRRYCIERWLASTPQSDEESDEAPGAPEPYHHPMVAKLLRDQCRRHRMRRSRHTRRRDWWIGADGCRAPRASAGASKRRTRRRAALTTHALLARGIAPVMGCRCGFTDQHMDMVQCDGCSRWLHLACVGVCHVDQLGAHEWVCDDCYERTAAVHAGDAAAAPADGLASHAHPGAMLSLAPSPQRDALSEPDVFAHAAGAHEVPLTSPLSSAASERAWRTPSPPPPLMDLLMTPSRHVAPDLSTASAVRQRHAAPLAASSPPTAQELPPTPSRYLMQTPRGGLPTPMYDTHTPATRAAHDWTMRTPSDWPTSLLGTPHDLLNSSASAWGLAHTPSTGGSSARRSRRDAWAPPESPTQATRGARARHAPASPLMHKAAAKTPATPRAVCAEAAPPVPSSPTHASSPHFGAGGEEESQRSAVASSSPYPMTPTQQPRASRALPTQSRAEHAGLVMNMHLDRATPPKPHAPSGLLSSLPSFLPDEA